MLRSFWLGWALLLLLLQLWHFFLPIDQRCRTGMGAAAALGLVLGGWRVWATVLRAVPRRWASLLLLAALAWWLSNRALGGPRFGDVGAYHLPIVQWDKLFRIVPGLGNLYVSYGHNDSYFLYAALLEIGPFAERSYHLTNSLLLLALFARAVLGLERLARTTRPCAPQDAYYALLLPAAVAEALGIFLTSPSPDQPLFLIGVVLAGELVAFCARGAPRRVPDFDLLAIALLATAAISIKLSIAALAAGAVAVTIMRSLWRERPFRSSALSTLTAVTIASGGTALWVAGNIILTGCPLFPSPFGILPVEWRVQVDALQWIQGPMTLGGPLWQVIWDWRWFLRRMDSLGWGAPEVLLPLGGALITSGIAVGARLIWWRSHGRRLTLAILFPAVLSFAYCFTYAPVPRYFGATFWILAADGIVLALGTAAFGHGRWRRRLTAGGIAIGLAVVLGRNPPLWLDLSTFEAKPAVRLHAERLPTGLEVQVPDTAHACWDGRLPCTPEPHPALRLRRPGELASGFMIDPAAATH